MSTLRSASVTATSHLSPLTRQIIVIISELPCKTPPPPSLPGEGAEMNYGPEVTTYRCPNGLEWSDGQWPYLENECLNKKWQYRTSLPACRSQLRGFRFPFFITIFHRAEVWP